MDQFLEKHKLPKFTQGKTDNLNSPIYINETESIVNNLPQKKWSGLDSFTGEFYQIFNEEMIQIFHSLLHKKEAQGTLPNSFYKTSITLIPKPDKDITRKKNYRPM